MLHLFDSQLLGGAVPLKKRIVMALMPNSDAPGV
jgi:hypothetical protein